MLHDNRERLRNVARRVSHHIDHEAAVNDALHALTQAWDTVPPEARKAWLTTVSVPLEGYVWAGC
ncbi:hypothetical protein L3Q67_41340 [Saccharothrix sp. AJ9571]|nr:hypothetical protein L3Q67_41340 [Saccharothrix sp. AJ9571]